MCAPCSAGWWVLDVAPMRTGWLCAFVLLCAPAVATTVAVIRTPREIFVAADSAVEGRREANFCKIGQIGTTSFAVEGMAEINVVTDGKSDSAKTFHVRPLAKRAAKRPGTIAEKALSFERDARTAFQRVVAQNKTDAPEEYKRYLSSRRQALQVIFFGNDPGNVPAFALIIFGVKDNAHGVPTITVEKDFCPGKDCYEPDDIRLLGESKKAIELTKQPEFPGSDLAEAAGRLVEAEIQDRPELVKPPVDVLELSVLGPNWVSAKPQCVAQSTESK